MLLGGLFVKPCKDSDSFLVILTTRASSALLFQIQLSPSLSEFTVSGKAFTMV